MSRSGKFVGALAGVSLLVGALATLPVPSAQAVTSYSGWAQREDGSTPGSGTTYADTDAGSSLQVLSVSGQIVVRGDLGGHQMSARFAPRNGQAVEAGQTYDAAAIHLTTPIAQTLPFQITRDGQMCGISSENLDYGPYFPAPIPTATGWFHVSELERDSQGTVTRFAATYEVNCQSLGGPIGFEGSVAVNSAQPAVAVPDAPAAPTAVSNLKMTNVGPIGWGNNTTTLTWTNPVGFGDVEVDSVFFERPFPALLGTYDGLRYRGRDAHFKEWNDFMATTTYRITARGPTGRLGAPTFITVMGNRLAIAHPKRITMGQKATFSGRLTESWDYQIPTDAEIMGGPPLPGRRVLLCKQSNKHYAEDKCDEVDRAVTAVDGTFTMSATPMKNISFEVKVPATNSALGNLGSALYTGVAPKTDLRAAEAVAPQDVVARAATSHLVTARKSVRRGAVIHFTTSRSRAGSKGTVKLQRLQGKKWRTIATRTLGRGSHRLAIPYRENAPGEHAYRVLKVADKYHVNGLSRTVHVRIR